MNVTEPTTHLGDQLKLPAALAPLTLTAQWCVWRGARGEDGRWRPVSFITAVDPAQAASINDPATWCDFLSASIAVRRGKADGFAFVLTAADPLIVMELGRCRHPRTGSIDIWAQNFLNVNRHSYVETTPAATAS